MASSAARQQALKLDLYPDTADFPPALAQAAERAVIATDADRRIVYWNKAAENLYGWTETEALGRDILSVTPFEAAEGDHILSPVERGGDWKGQFPLRRKNGEKFDGLVFIRAIQDDAGLPAGVVGFSCALPEAAPKRFPLASAVARLLDLTTRSLEAERSDQLQLVIVICAVGGATLLRLLLGSFTSELPPFNVYYPAILLAALFGGWRAGAATATISAALAWFLFLTPQLAFRFKSEQEAVGLALSLLSAAALVAVAQWVRALIRKLRESRDSLDSRNFQYNTLFEAMSEGFALCEAIRDSAGRLVDYVIVEINPALQKMLGVGPEVAGRRLSDGEGDYREWLEVCERVLQSGTPWRYTSHNRSTGRWHDIHIDRVGPDRMSQFFIDITDRKEAEATQAQLFVELNHRVKNNFAVVSGILRMQARQAPEPKVREQLMKAVDRVQGIADIHGSLYKGGRTNDVEFGTYVNELCDRLAASILDGERVRLKVDAQSADLNLDTAIALGMIVNELVTNAAKHAYPPPRQGVIHVRFLRADDCFLLTIADDGCGLPPDEQGHSAGLGMKLVPALAAQANAQFTIRNQSGLTYELRIPLSGAEIQKPSHSDMA